MSDINDLEFKVEDSLKAFYERNTWLAFMPEFAKDDKGNEYMRKRCQKNTYLVEHACRK